MRTNTFRRITAAVLAVITLLSAMSVGITSAAAASAQDIAVSASNKAIDAMVEMGCDCIPGGKILGAAGVAVIDGLFGNIFGKDEPTGPSSKDIDDHITRSTDEIVKDINNLNNDMKAYFNKEALSDSRLLDEIKKENSKIDINLFSTPYNQLTSSHNRFIDALTGNMYKISNTFGDEKLGVIDETTYRAFKNILSVENVENRFYDVDVYLSENTTNYDESYYMVLANAMKSINDCDTEVAMSARHNNNRIGVIDLNELANVPDYDKTIYQLRGYEANMLLYYADCVQIEQMRYDVDNYEYCKDHANDMQSCLAYIALNKATYTQQINNYTARMSAIANAYNAASSMLKSAKAATLTITANGQDYTLSFDKAIYAWKVANTICKSDPDGQIAKVELTLEKDWIADKNYGFALDNETANFCQSVSSETCMSLVMNGFFINEISQGHEVVLNLNGYTLDGSNSSDANTIAGFYNFGSLTINGDEAHKSRLNGFGILLVNVRDEQNFTINNVVINSKQAINVTGSIPDSMIIAFGPTNVTLNNCDITTHKLYFYATDNGTCTLNDTVVNNA